MRELVRQLEKEGQRARRLSASARGKLGGRPLKHPPETIERLRELWLAGRSVQAVARRLNMTAGQVGGQVRRLGIQRKQLRT